MANISAESEIELSTPKSESKIAESESMSNVNGDVKGSVEEQVSTRSATDDTVKCDSPTTQSDLTSKHEPMDDAETCNNEPPEKKENADKSPAELLKNDYKLEFDAEGGLCDSTDKSKRFDYNYHDTRGENQDRYEDIGNIVTEIIYDKMEKEQGLKRVYIGEEKPNEKRSFFFASEAMLDEEKRKQEKLIVLIHGSGAVRAGQWARSIIINDEHGLETGTQIPYIKNARADGFSVIVTNTNENYDRSKGRYCAPYDHSRSPEEHTEYVWKKFARHADRVAIVAHSYGGVVVSRLADKFHQDFDEKVFAIALTDSVHGGSMGSHAKRIFADRAQNWVTSDEKLDTPIQSSRFGSCIGSKWEDASRVSAGHIRHEWTSHACIKSVFVYFGDKLSSFAAPGKKRDHSISDTEQDDDNSDNNMSDGGDRSGSRSAAVAETCTRSSNINRAPDEQREAGDGAAAVPPEPSQPCSSDTQSTHGQGQPRDSCDNDNSQDLFVARP